LGSRASKRFIYTSLSNWQSSNALCFVLSDKLILNLLHDSGYPNVKFEKRIDFEKLYNQRLN